MNCKTKILPFIWFSCIVNGQFPIDLGPNDSTEPHIFTASTDTEFLFTLTASANTNWSETDAESANLVVAVDGNWNNYNQDILIYAGQDQHDYYTSIGPIFAGEHSIQFKFDYAK